MKEAMRIMREILSLVKEDLNQLSSDSLSDASEREEDAIIWIVHVSPDAFSRAVRFRYIKLYLDMHPTVYMAT